MYFFLNVNNKLNEIRFHILNLEIQFTHCGIKKTLQRHYRMTCSDIEAFREVIFKFSNVAIILISKLNHSRILEYVILTIYSEAYFFLWG